MTADRHADPIAPLWRAAQAFRLLSCLYALGFQIAVNPDLTRPGLAWTLCAVLLGWSAACAVAYLRGFGRRPAWVVTEIALTIGLMWTNRLVASAQWAAETRPGLPPCGQPTRYSPPRCFSAQLSAWSPG